MFADLLLLRPRLIPVGRKDGGALLVGPLYRFKLRAVLCCIAHSLGLEDKLVNIVLKRTPVRLVALDVLVVFATVNLLAAGQGAVRHQLAHARVLLHPPQQQSIGILIADIVENIAIIG